MDTPLLVNPSTTIEIQEIPDTSPVTTITKPETSLPYGKILLRFAVIFSIVAACLVSNNMASNSFEVSIINGAANTPIGRRFHTMFVSNGKISQFMYNSNRMIEQVLYPTGFHPMKPINHITIHFSGQNLTDMAAVHTGHKPGEFSVILSPGFLSSSDPPYALRTMLHRVMARVRVHNGPEEVVTAMVEYLTSRATPEATGIVDTRFDSSCWSDGFLKFCESQDNGFVSKLNRQLVDQSDSGLLDRNMCEAYKASLKT